METQSKQDKANKKNAALREKLIAAGTYAVLLGLLIGPGILIEWKIRNYKGPRFY